MKGDYSDTNSTAVLDYGSASNLPYDKQIKPISKNDEGLQGIIEEPFDEPTPDIQACCCPCPKIIVAGPFVAFGPLM